MWTDVPPDLVCENFFWEEYSFYHPMNQAENKRSDHGQDGKNRNEPQSEFFGFFIKLGTAVGYPVAVMQQKAYFFYGRGIFTAVFLTGFFIFEYVVEFNNLAGL